MIIAGLNSPVAANSLALGVNEKADGWRLVAPTNLGDRIRLQLTWDQCSPGRSGASESKDR